MADPLRGTARTRPRLESKRNTFRISLLNLQAQVNTNHCAPDGGVCNSLNWRELSVQVRVS